MTYEGFAWPGGVKTRVTLQCLTSQENLMAVFVWRQHPRSLRHNGEAKLSLFGFDNVSFSALLLGDLEFVPKRESKRTLLNCCEQLLLCSLRTQRLNTTPTSSMWLFSGLFVCASSVPQKHLRTKTTLLCSRGYTCKVHLSCILLNLTHALSSLENTIFAFLFSKIR